MTGIIAFKYPKSVQIISDTAFTDSTGRILFFDRKVSIFHRQPIAIACRASASLEARSIVEKIAVFSATGAAEGDADAVLDFARDMFLGMAHEQVFADFFIGAWTRSGPALFCVQCAKMVDLPVGEMIPVDQVAAPAFQVQDIRDVHITAEDAQQEDFLERFGPDLMSAQRNKLLPTLTGGMSEPRHLVGGQCELAKVSETGVAISALCEWDDYVGELIDPSRSMRWRKSRD